MRVFYTDDQIFTCRVHIDAVQITIVDQPQAGKISQTVLALLCLSSA